MTGRGWVVWEGEEIHVAPVDDAIEHELYSLDCICGPEIDFSGHTNVVIHASLDGREQLERSA